MCEEPPQLPLHEPFRHSRADAPSVSSYRMVSSSVQAFGPFGRILCTCFQERKDRRFVSVKERPPDARCSSSTASKSAPGPRAVTPGAVVNPPW